MMMKLTQTEQILMRSTLIIDSFSIFRKFNVGYSLGSFEKAKAINLLKDTNNCHSTIKTLHHPVTKIKMSTFKVLKSPPYFEEVYSNTF